MAPTTTELECVRSLRSAPPEVNESIGQRLGAIRGCGYRDCAGASQEAQRYSWWRALLLQTMILHRAQR